MIFKKVTLSLTDCMNGHLVMNERRCKHALRHVACNDDSVRLYVSIASVTNHTITFIHESYCHKLSIYIGYELYHTAVVVSIGYELCHTAVVVRLT